MTNEENSTAAKLVVQYLYPIINKTLGTSSKRGVAAILLALGLWTAKRGLNLKLTVPLNFIHSLITERRLFHRENSFSKLMRLLRLCIPSWKTKQFWYIIALIATLICKTYFTITLATINGKLVKSMMNGNLGIFIRRMVYFGMMLIPASLSNSAISYFTNKIAISLRYNMTKVFIEKYLQSLVFFKVKQIDSRILNIEHTLTTDIDEWSKSISSLFPFLFKPILDILLYSKKLAESVGIEGPLLLIAWYLFIGILIKYVSPPFGQLTQITNSNVLIRHGSRV